MMRKKVTKPDLKVGTPGESSVDAEVPPVTPEAAAAKVPAPDAPDSEAAAPPEPPPEPAGLVEEVDLAALREKAAQAEANWNRFVQASADLENIRKRTSRERREAARYANESLMDKLIPVLDSFEMAVQATNGESAAGEKGAAGRDAVRDGVRMILSQFKAALADAGLEEIDAAGQAFDPALHEAVSTQESEEVEDGHVLQQLRKGYRLRERLLRPATVVVARKPSA